MLDGTVTCKSGKTSGIERVVLAILEHFPATWDGESVSVFIRQNNIYRVDAHAKRWLDRRKRFQANAWDALPIWYRQSASALCKLVPHPKLRRWLIPSVGHLGLFKMPGVIWGAFCSHRACRPSNQLIAGEGDLIVLPDAYWAEPRIWKAVDQARMRGAFVVTLIHDLIPLIHPKFVGTKRHLKFKRYFGNVVKHSDLILTVSQTVRVDVLENIANATKDTEFVPKVEAFRLGADFANRFDGPVRSDLMLLFLNSSESVFLVVGTFDPRKNQAMVLDAFEQLWRDNVPVKLCFVGRVGKYGQRLAERIRKHSRFRRELFLFEDLTDAELHFSYVRAQALIMPSLAEGFGLPIVEAEWYGKKVFASDIPIHREVAGASGEFFSPHDSSELASKIANWESMPASSKISGNGTRPLTWRASIEQMAKLALSAHAERSMIIHDFRRAG